MDQTAYYLIQNSNGSEKINFQRLFDKCHIGSEIESLLNKIWHYINYYSDVTEEQELEFLDMFKSLTTVKIDKYTLFKNKMVDKLTFEYVVDNLVETKKSKNTEEVVWIDYSGFFYFIFGIDEKKLREILINKAFRIDPRFFERMNIETPNFMRRALIKLRKVIDVCKV